MSLVFGGVLVAKETHAASAILYFTKEFIIKPLVRMLANALENKILNKVSGMASGLMNKEGRPNFITNWRNYTLESQGRGNDIFRTILAGNKEFCPYFSDDLKKAFGAEKYSGNYDTVQNKVSAPGLPSFDIISKCTLPSNFNVGNFSKDFAKGGGWDTWNKLIQPQNNFYGAFLLSLAEQQRQMTVEEQSAKDYSVAGQGWLGQKLGTGNSGLGPTGCKNVEIGNKFSTVTVARCTFMGKELTPAQLFGNSAAKSIDQKMGRVGGATELADVILGMVSAVVSGVTNRLYNFIASNTGLIPGGGGGGGGGFPETPASPGQGDPTFNINGQQICIDDCLKPSEGACTQKAKEMACTAQGGSGGTGGTIILTPAPSALPTGNPLETPSETASQTPAPSAPPGGGGAGGTASCTEGFDQAVFDACMADARAKCEVDCTVTTGTNP